MKLSVWEPSKEDIMEIMIIEEWLQEEDRMTNKGFDFKALRMILILKHWIKKLVQSGNYLRRFLIIKLFRSGNHMKRR